MRFLLRALADERGSVTAEYALVAAAFGVVMLVTFGLIQSETGSQLATEGTNMANLAVTPP